jgi:hypothetical protein
MKYREMRTAFKAVLVMLALYAAYLFYMRYFYYRMEYSGGSSSLYSAFFGCGGYEGFADAMKKQVGQIQNYLAMAKNSSMGAPPNTPRQLPVHM